MAGVMARLTSRWRSCALALAAASWASSLASTARCWLSRRLAARDAASEDTSQLSRAAIVSLKRSMDFTAVVLYSHIQSYTVIYSHCLVEALHGPRRCLPARSVCPTRPIVSSTRAPTRNAHPLT
eukprot:1184040-Prorocentrum_minimum.AAC.1